MFNFFLEPISQEANQQINNQFLDLNASQKKQLVKQISSSERVALIAIISNTAHAEVGTTTGEVLQRRVLEASKLTSKITRSKDKRVSMIGMREIQKFKNWLLSQFNYMSGDKANALIKEALMKQALMKQESKELPFVSSQKLNNLLEDARNNVQPGIKLNLAKILEENNFSKEIKGQIFSDSFSLKNMELVGITFENCEFDWTPCSNSSLEKVIFRNCNIYNLCLMNSSLKDCLFYNCETREMAFIGAELNNVTFDRSTLISTSFENASLNSCIFSKSALPATHFFETNIKNSLIRDSDLKDTVFFGTFNQFEMDNKTKETARVTRPTTAILVNPEARGIANPKAYMKLDQSADTIPIRINMQAQNVKREGVNNEVELALSKVGSYNKNKASIPQRLIAELAINPNSESARILKKAERLASQVDSLFLPGGEDVPPALYGQEIGEQTNWGDDYRRSILELGLIHQSFTKGIPLMAVCRGFQMSNVYFGAQLIQHIDGHKGVQRLELSTPGKRGLYAEAMKNSIFCASFHHQAVSEESPATEHLETAVRYQGIVKAAELDKSGAAPMILLQFHPEFYKAKTADSMSLEVIDRWLNFTMSEENEAFWDILSDSAKAHRAKRIILEKIPKAAVLDENTLSRRKASLEKLEDDRAKIFNAYKKSQAVLMKKI